ncbi:MAG: aminotransferase class V-fold PLP-dependent enzyme [Oscillospiraceae bacterium]|nr:aminotransferase class V-fold PLP-dependent enzyme [Oscillospiraceae bacterium]
MKTPICDFVRRYAEEAPLRLHMPGHKGVPVLGMEHLDITEVQGADSLYAADGIIRESEENASALFGCPTFYSTEGASQCIRAMVYLAVLHGKKQGKQPKILAARNVHKTFLGAAALLDVQVDWLYPEEDGSYLSCHISPQRLEQALSRDSYTAVYVTSPDYLGDVADIAALSRVCRRHGVLLLVDGAHGAYLKFLQPSKHPMDLGADVCCTSAHKTLPVLTGGAYLHIASRELCAHAKDALAMFGTTSPSYLILQSLDAANALLETLPQQLLSFLPRVEKLKKALEQAGFELYGNEPLKLTLAPKSHGYTGEELAQYLLEHNMVCEFADPDHLVLMLSPQLREDLERLEQVLTALAKRSPNREMPPKFSPAQRVCSLRDAMLSPKVTVPAEESEGRVLASPSVSCPPAVPILACGERIDAHTVACLRYYGIETVTVME